MLKINKIDLIALEKVKDKFWSLVDIQDKESCWEWKRTNSGRGYGIFKMGSKYHPSHRVAYTLIYGDVPDDLLICHHCDNKLCCNPLHLFKGTVKDNAIDMVNKGRWNGGRDKKITEKNREDIKRLIELGTPIAEIAKLHNINRATIYRNMAIPKRSLKKYLESLDKPATCRNMQQWLDSQK